MSKMTAVTRGGAFFIKEIVVPYCVKTIKEGIQHLICKALLKLSLLLLTETLVVYIMVCALKHTDYPTSFIIWSYEMIRSLQIAVTFLKISYKLLHFRRQYARGGFIQHRLNLYIAFFVCIALLQILVWIYPVVVWGIFILCIVGVVFARKELYYALLLQRWIVDWHLLKYIGLYLCSYACCLLMGSRLYLQM